MVRVWGCYANPWSDALVFIVECSVLGRAQLEAAHWGLTFGRYISCWHCLPVLCFPIAQKWAALLHHALLPGIFVCRSQLPMIWNLWNQGPDNYFLHWSVGMWYFEHSKKKISSTDTNREGGRQIISLAEERVLYLQDPVDLTDFQSCQIQQSRIQNQL